MKLKNDNAGRFGFFPVTWFSRKSKRGAGKLEGKLKGKEDVIERAGARKAI